MHNNYYFLRQLSRQLREQLIGFQIVEVFSQVKDELIICLSKGSEGKYIKAHLDPSFCCLSFPETFSRAGKNSVDLFPKIVGRKIINIVQQENDRSFYMELSGGFRLLFKMYGNRSNVILLKVGEVKAVFKNSLKQDFKINISELNKQIEINPETFVSLEENYKKLIPTFGSAFDNYFSQKNYAVLTAANKFDCLLELLHYLEAPNYYVHHTEGAIPKLTLYKITPEDLSYPSPIEAINAFYKRYHTVYRVEKEKAIIQNTLQSQITKSESYILKNLNLLEKLNSSESYQHIGDLIMANMHLIQAHVEEAELIDFFTGNPVTVKLKSTLSPQHNAEKFYKKAKKQQMEKDALKKNIEIKKEQIEDLKRQLSESELLSPQRFRKKERKEKLTKGDLPYNLEVFMGYEILIGKNAKKNERLTFQVAKKDDLFLHAKDCSGSHVIIKNKAKQNFPVSVIEKAASYAAFYSKNKQESLCRVLYTPKKYVRKAKGAPAGAVTIEREKVILVKPESIKKS